MLLKVHPDNPPERHIRRAVEVLRKGGVIIYPTDTVYALGCDPSSKKAHERICRIRGLKPEKANFSMVVDDLKMLGEYANHVSTPVYKLIRRATPGPFTFILEASREVPRHFRSSKKQVGIRLPNHNVPLALIRELGSPIVSASLKSDDELLEYVTDPELIYEDFGSQVDLFLDSGFGGNVPSTVVDCSSGEPELIREGLGDISLL